MILINIILLLSITNPEHWLSFCGANQDRSPAYTRVMRGLCICAFGLCTEDKVYSLMIVSAHNKRGNI